MIKNILIDEFNFYSTITFALIRLQTKSLDEIYFCVSVVRSVIKYALYFHLLIVVLPYCTLIPVCCTQIIIVY